MPAFVASLPALLLMAGLLVIPASALDFDSKGALQNYRLDFWGEKDGLPQSRIRRIVQTGDGYLWLGTEGGLARFDGVGFTLFNAKTGDLKDNEVGSLKVDHTGGLWIGTMGGGVTLLKDGVFVSYTTADGLPDNFVRVVDEDPEGNIWFATAGGVGRYFQGAFHSYTTKDGLAGNVIIRICATTGQGVFALAENKVHRFVNGQFVVDDRLVQPQEGRLSNLIAGKDGSLWVTFENGLVKRLKDGVISTYSVEGNFSARNGGIYEDRQGNVWLHSQDGLLRLRNGKFLPALPQDDTTRLGFIFCLCEDQEGNLWLGSEANGLARLSSTPFTTIAAADGLTESSTRTVFQDSKGSIWIGTTAGFAEWDHGSIKNYRDLDGVPLPTVTSFAEDPSGTLWLGVGGELLKLRDGVLTRDPAWKRVFDIKAIYRDPLGRMWVATDGDGLHEFDGDRATVFRTQDGLASNSVRAVWYDRQGALWVATLGNGVNKYADGKFTTYTVRDVLGSNRVTGIYEDETGALWFANRGGLTRLKDGRFFNFTARDGMFSSFVSGMLDDGRGSFWFSCSQGIFRVSKADFGDYAAGKIKAVRSVAYGVEAGMLTTAFGAGLQPNVWKTTDGRLLFCSLKGLVVVDPAHLSSNTYAPPVHIEKVLINKQVRPAGRYVKIPPGEGEVEIHYTALSYQAPAKVRFKYRLEGFDRDWVEAGGRRFAYYTNLPPGPYKFRVIACNNDGVWNETGDSFSFVLKPYFHQTVWFYVLCVLGVILLIGLIYEFRVNQLKARERTLRQRVAEEVAKVKVLHGLLPICASCKKVRDDKGYWNQLETYLKEHSEMEITHGICPECMKKLYPGFVDEVVLEKSEPDDPGGQNPAGPSA